MPETRAPDVAVVGASPAGLAAARAAGQAGAETLLVEAGRIGHPEPPAVVGFDHLWPGQLSPPIDAVRGRFEGIRLASPGGHELDVQAPGRIVDRSRLDRWLAQRARSAGARVLEDTGPVQVEAPGVLVRDQARLEADVVVFADGARSIARALVDPVRAPEELVWGVTHEVRVPVSEDRLPITVGSHAPGGRTQIVPLDGARAWHWTFARRPREEAIALADAALERAARRRGWPDAAVEDAERLHVAPDPVFQRPGTLAADRTLVTGGAAGLGGLEVGLAAGHRAGSTAASAVADGPAAREDLAAYERHCRARFAPAYRGLAELMSLAERAPDAVLDALARPWDGQKIPLDRLAGLGVADAATRASTMAALVRRWPTRAAGSLAGAASASLASLR